MNDYLFDRELATNSLSPGQFGGSIQPVAPVSAPKASYTPLVPGATPTFGTSGQSVSDLQTQLNATHSGQAGYVPLVVDGKYGKLTQAAVGFQNPVSNPPSAPSDSAAGIANSFNYTGNPDADSALNDYLSGIRSDANQKVDPNSIYNSNLAMFQGQIDALNKVYNDQLNRARIEGAGRIESRKFSQGRSGQIGSGTGEAGVNAVQDANNDVYRAIDDERNAAIAGIMGQVRKGSADEFAAKTAAKRAGADALLTFYDNAGARKSAKLNPIIASLVNSGIDPTTLDSDSLNSILSGVGVTKDELVAAYQGAKSTSDAAKSKADLERQKTEADIAKTTAETGQIGKITPYQSAQIAVEWYKAKNPTIGASDKKLNAIGGIATLFSPSQIVNGVKTNVVPGTDIPYIDNNGYATPEGWKTILREAAGDNITKKDLLSQFGGLIPVGLETKYGLTAADVKILRGELPVSE